MSKNLSLEPLDNTDGKYGIKLYMVPYGHCPEFYPSNNFHDIHNPIKNSQEFLKEYYKSKITIISCELRKQKDKIKNRLIWTYILHITFSNGKLHRMSDYSKEIQTSLEWYYKEGQYPAQATLFENSEIGLQKYNKEYWESKPDLSSLTTLFKI